MEKFCECETAWEALQVRVTGRHEEPPIVGSGPSPSVICLIMSPLHAHVRVLVCVYTTEILCKTQDNPTAIAIDHLTDC